MVVLDKNLKQEMIEIVTMSFETGHGGFKGPEDFNREYENYPEVQKKIAWQYYCDLVALGPVGFYETFKDSYDFDPMFVEEYGRYCEDDDND